MMMFQMFSTLAVLVLFASNAALAAPQDTVEIESPAAD